MIWLSGRQFRGPAVVGAIGLAVFAAGMLLLGVRLRHAAAVTDYQSLVYAMDAVLLAGPALLGLFWGAPMIARELESGTAALAWNQSVTRRHWLAVKLGVVGLAALVTGGLASMLLSWAAAPLDRVTQDRFSTLLFGTRGVVPAAYAMFAVFLGAALGLLIRRTLPAMALTAAVFVAVQVVLPNLVRPHLLAPRTMAAPVTAEVVRHLTFLGSEPTISGLKIPGGWVTSSSDLRTADGRRIAQERYAACVGGSFDAMPDCLGALRLHVDIAYQPADRYWPFQGLESAVYLALAGLLALIAARRVTRVAG
jgi:hypothetical protein